MIVWLASALARPLVVVDVPFPTERIFDKPDRVCLRVPLPVPDTDSETTLGDFSLSCTVRSGMLFACVQLEVPTWPEKVPPLQCGPENASVRVRPVRAFDPTEDIWDGVSLVRDLAVLQATYRVDHPDAPGILPGGRCAIQDGRFEFKTKNPEKRQTCTLVLGEDVERTIEIRLVRRLPASP